MGNFKSFWIFGFERWGGLRPAYMSKNVGNDGKAWFKPLCFGLWIRCKKNRVKDYQKEFDNACRKLCGVLYQLHTGYAEEDTGVYRTSYNYDADAVWFLSKHGYVMVSDGEWPRTKYLSFSFTDKFKKD